LEKVFSTRVDVVEADSIHSSVVTPVRSLFVSP